MPAPSVPVIFIHGLWSTPPPGSPGLNCSARPATTRPRPAGPATPTPSEQSRKNAAAVADKGIDDITTAT